MWTRPRPGPSAVARSGARSPATSPWPSWAQLWLQSSSQRCRPTSSPCALACYTVLAVLVTLALAVALAATRELAPAHRVPGRRLAGRGGTVLGLRADPPWTLPSGLAALAGAWFLVQVALTLSRRRCNETLWLTSTEVGPDAPWGRERVRRDQVTRVRGLSGTPYLILQVDEPIQRRLCPRPWRRHRPTDPAAILVNCAWMGHDATDLAAWLRTELGAPTHLT